MTRPLSPQSRSSCLNSSCCRISSRGQERRQGSQRCGTSVLAARAPEPHGVAEHSFCRPSARAHACSCASSPPLPGARGPCTCPPGTPLPAGPWVGT